MSVATETAEATSPTDMKDRFAFDLYAFDLHFPCVVCIHREKPEAECCGGCRYFFK